MGKDDIQSAIPIHVDDGDGAGFHVAKALGLERKAPHVPQHGRRAADVGEHDVEQAVVVQVADRDA